MITNADLARSRLTGRPALGKLAVTSNRHSDGSRLTSLDVMRGLVVLLLIPDLSSGFSLGAMAERNPTDPTWQALGRQFSHVAWTGAAIWDLVMPAFIFVVGVSLGLSYAARRSAGNAPGEFMLHAAIRSAALVVLGLLLARGVNGRIDELWPFAVLALGLPWSRWAGRLTKRGPWPPRSAGQLLAAAVLLAALGWVASQPPRHEGFEPNQVLLLIGLAYLPAALLQPASARVQLLAAAAVLAGYAAAFFVYTPTGIQPVADGVVGLRSHWNNGDNAAAAFDRWMLNLLPGRPVYTGNPNGYHTLQFVPLISVMLTGAVIGRAAAGRGSLRDLLWPITLAALIALILSAALAIGPIPSIKRLWTPTWALFSTAVAMLVLVVCSVLFDTDSGRVIATPLVVLGSNALLLYVLAHNERWRVVALAGKAFGHRLESHPMQPVLESLLVLAVWWALAATLHRWRVWVRL